MPPPTLHYAPVSLTPVRFGFIALASALLALTSFFLFAVNFFNYFHPHSGISPRPFTFLVFIFPPFLNAIAIFVAVYCFNAALPSATPAKSLRRPFLACAAAAATILLSYSAYLILFLISPSSNPFLDNLIRFLLFLATFLQLPLTAAAALFFYFTARRLNRTPLGILAALAFLPNFFLSSFVFLYITALFLNLANRLPHFPNDLLYRLNLSLLTLLWLTLALVTATLALKHPRQPATSL